MENSNSNEIKKGPWTREEDQKLLAYIEQHGHGSWRSLPAKAGLKRCGKSCRLRWTNYLRPDIKRGKFSTQEEKSIIRLHALLGNRWSAISAHLPNRTDNEIKNYWNTRLKKRLVRMGIDPTTHKPKNNLGSSKQAADISHMAQWETARLEAEARLVRRSKLLNLNNLRKAATCPPPPPPQLPCLDVLKAWQATSTNNSFFRSPNPTTLKFSCNNNDSTTVPSVGLYGSSFMVNDVMPVKDNYVVDAYDHNSHLSDFVFADGCSYGFNMNSGIVGESEEDIGNYWNELLNLVSSDNLTFV